MDEKYSLTDRRLTELEADGVEVAPFNVKEVRDLLEERNRLEIINSMWQGKKWELRRKGIYDPVDYVIKLEAMLDTCCNDWENHPLFQKREK